MSYEEIPNKENQHWTIMSYEEFPKTLMSYKEIRNKENQHWTLMSYEEIPNKENQHWTIMSYEEIPNKENQHWTIMSYEEFPNSGNQHWTLNWSGLGSQLITIAFYVKHVAETKNTKLLYLKANWLSFV